MFFCDSIKIILYTNYNSFLLSSVLRFILFFVSFNLIDALFLAESECNNFNSFLLLVLSQYGCPSSFLLWLSNLIRVFFHGCVLIDGLFIIVIVLLSDVSTELMFCVCFFEFVTESESIFSSLLSSLLAELVVD